MCDQLVIFIKIVYLYKIGAHVVERVLMFKCIGFKVNVLLYVFTIDSMMYACASTTVVILIDFQMLMITVVLHYKFYFIGFFFFISFYLCSDGNEFHLIQFSCLK